MKAKLLAAADKLNIYPLFNGYTKNTATIFMLHRFTPAGVERPDCTSASLLAKFLDYLKRNDYRVMPLSGYVDALIRGRDTRKTVVFTVDDGYRDIYEHAFEVFKRFDCTAAVFLTSDFIEGKLFFWWDAIEYVVNHANTSEFDLAFLGPGKFRAENLERRAELVARITEHCKLLNNADKLSFINDFGNKVGVEIPPVPPDEYAPLNWEQIKEMRTSGIEFFAHTVTHPILSKVPVEQQRNEICRSRAVLENHLNTRCDIFCYPNGGPGDFTEDTIAALKSAGFIAAVTGIAGFDSTKGPTDLFRIRRFSIPSNEILFKQYICGLENFKARLMSRG